MNRKLVLLILLALAIVGCAAVNIFGVGRAAQSGRNALMAGNPEQAVTDFKRVAESQPDYVVDTPPLRQGIWTYLGRAYYDSGKTSEAREAFSQALKRDSSDFMARLYLGLILLREKSSPPKADKSLGLKEILYALGEKITSKRIAGMVKERGINFTLTVEAERELKKAGADNELMEQIRISARENTTIAETPAGQGLKEVEQALKDMQNWQARVLKTEYGRFWDTRKRVSSQIQTSLTMISTKRTDRPDFITGLESLGKTIEEEVDLSQKAKQES